jgi:hypothetical protein
MTSTPLPEQGMLRADRRIMGDSERATADEVPDELKVEDEIIDAPEDASDPERAAAGRRPEESISDRLDSANESDLQEQAIVVPEDEDERVQ